MFAIIHFLYFTIIHYSGWEIVIIPKKFILVIHSSNIRFLVIHYSLIRFQHEIYCCWKNSGDNNRSMAVNKFVSQDFHDTIAAL